MKERQYLKKTILLCGESDGETFKRVFHILKRINEGASSVCYEAYHEGSGRGVLKEFYPQDAFGLERRPDGQLVHAPGFRDAYARFTEAQRRYMEPYEMLLQAKQSGADADLATFIPAFEIYHGCDPDGHAVGTTYIWTPGPALEAFDRVCEEIHRHPGAEPEHKLVTVLTAIESLTRCICALHRADMVHRDIKPSNFGFLKRGSRVLTQTISVFDINSVCSVYGENSDSVGTDGYREPEAGYEEASNQTDIYSIGACLFHAVAVTEETAGDGYLYKPEYYDRLRELVDESKLIRASEANAHPRLRNALAGILRRCLCERTYRYPNCEELLQDLETALYYALPSEIARGSRAGERWILTDVESSLDVNRDKNSLLAIQYHLYAHPLYLCSPEGEEQLNVLVVGFGNYGQKFLDVCLQSGQLRNRDLSVTVVSDDETDKELYLSERPELTDFFRVDGSVPEGQEAYGDLRFETVRLERDDPGAIASALEGVMCEHYDTRRPRYVFIALGDDALNAAAAGACRNAAEVFEMPCAVSYICEKPPAAGEGAPLLFPLHVNADIQASPLYGEIERMAFNTHLVWEKDPNADFRAVRAAFRKPYNHDSCVSSVLSLKYKLWSMGIDLDAAGFRKAAGLFREKLADRANRGLKNELIWIEHRRWVAEKLCQGWRRIADLEECAGGDTKDEKRKRHVCILRSRPDQKLAAEFRPDTNLDKWDTASHRELEELDELDRMSVELHRMYAARAEEAKRHNLLSGSAITGIRSLIEGNKRAVTAFQEWYSCLKDIRNGDVSKARLYKGMTDSFLEAAEELPPERKKSLREQVRAFYRIFYPVAASMEYRDWKQDDVAFIDNIPYVLTYTENTYLAVPFVTGDSSRRFQNVAAAMVAGPSRILYLCYPEKEEHVQELLDAVPYVMEFMQKKHFRAAVEFFLFYPEGMGTRVTEALAEKLRRMGGGRIRQVKRIPLDRGLTAAAAVTALLKMRTAENRFLAAERNDASLSYVLSGAGFYESFPSYRFDSANMKFQSLKDCESLGYIRKTPYITVTDMIALSLSSSESSNQPEFYADFKALWKKYTEKRSLWKSLCDLLGTYAAEHDTLASLRKLTPREKNGATEEIRYILPFACHKSAEKILRSLLQLGIAEKGSYVSSWTSDSCEAVILDRCGYRGKYDRLFANVYALMLPDAVSVHMNTRSHEAAVVFDDLMVRDAQLPAGRAAEMGALMDWFREKNYVIGLSVSPEGRMSFTYASGQIKALLTTAGKMLEVYTYHKLRELGRFDDVVSSFEIDWEGTDVRSELDCVVTKGFRSLFVECKARPDIEQEFYYRLSSLAKRFGVNATAVLIADTQEKSFYDNAPINDMQRQRGRILGVVTIWKPEEINNIGHTLLKVINGKYGNEEG